MNKIIQSLFFFVSICALWVGVFFILPDFIDNPYTGPKGLVITIAYWGVVSLASFFVIYLMAIYKYVFIVLFPVFSLLGAILGFYRYAFKASLTPMIVDATLNNDYGTTTDLISIELIIFVSISLIISFFFVYYRNKTVKVKKHLLHFLFALTGITLTFTINSRIKSNVLQRFPYNIYYSLSEYTKLNKAINAERIDFEPDFDCSKMKDKNDSLIIVFVLGESARADHFSLNGYHRHTNQFLSQREHVYSLPNVYSEYTHTVRSLPHILTRADSINEYPAFNEFSFIALFNKCGYRTEWISNQDPANSYIFFMNECDTIIYAHPEKTVYNFNNWFDEDLIPFVEKSVSKSYRNNLMILHTIGSHWYYNSHFTKNFEGYTPVTKSRIIAQNSREEIINSYDNTILYTDYFLSRLISIFDKKNALLIYVSDHGEILGEDGLWLHASDHLAAKNPAALIWMSEKYIKNYPEKRKALIANKDKRWRTDFIFHSVISGANLPSSAIKKDFDIFSINE
jgi:glucan phosphoethanolaminetransferase (alkaline phosphatase superfamily)